MKKLQILALLSLFFLSGLQLNGQEAKTPDEISVEKLQDADRLTDLVSEDKIDGNIHSFTISIKKGDDILIYENDGNLFSEDLKGALGNVSSNDHIWIDDISITRIKKVTMSASLAVTE